MGNEVKEPKGARMETKGSAAPEPRRAVEGARTKHPPSNHAAAF